MMTILFVVGLPSGKAISERVFSQSRYIATSFRPVIGCDTVCAMLSAKWNSENMTTKLSVPLSLSVVRYQRNIDTPRAIKWGKCQRWTFSDSADQRVIFVTLPSVVSVVSIAPN